MTGGCMLKLAVAERQVVMASLRNDTMIQLSGERL